MHFFPVDSETQTDPVDYSAFMANKIVSMFLKHFLKSPSTTNITF